MYNPPTRVKSSTYRLMFTEVGQLAILSSSNYHLFRIHANPCQIHPIIITMSGSRVPAARIALIKTLRRCLVPCVRCVRRLARGEVAVDIDCAFSKKELHTIAFVDEDGERFNKCGYCLSKSNSDCVHVGRPSLCGHGRY